MFTCILLLSGGNNMTLTCRSWRPNMQTYVVSLTLLDFFFLPVCRGLSCTLDNFELPLMFFPMFPSSPFQPTMWRDWRSRRRSWSSSSRNLLAGRTFWLWDLPRRSRKCKSAQYVLIMPFFFWQLPSTLLDITNITLTLHCYWEYWFQTFIQTVPL